MAYGERTDDCERASTSDDSIKSVFVGLTDGEMTNGCDKNPSSNDEVDVLDFLRGRSTIIQSVGSMLISSKKIEVTVSHVIIVHFRVDQNYS